MMLLQIIWPIAKYQDNKYHPKFVQKAKLQTFIVTFLLGICNLKPVALQISWRNV